MKKIILYLFFTLSALASYAQTAKKTNTDTTKQALIAVPYRLFPTQNVWNFIKLNTRNGQMWMVQFSMKDEQRFTTFLNSEKLVIKEQELNDRFALYPTQNVYTFILLDQIDGRTWQVQWSFEPEKRGIMPIE